MAVTLLNANLVGETGMWKGCGHHADRFVIELSGFAKRLKVGSNAQVGTYHRHGGMPVEDQHKSASLSATGYGEDVLSQLGGARAINIGDCAEAPDRQIGDTGHSKGGPGRPCLDGAWVPAIAIVGFLPGSHDATACEGPTPAFEFDPDTRRDRSRAVYPPPHDAVSRCRRWSP